MKYFLTLTLLFGLLQAAESIDPYNTDYCHGDEKTLWEGIVSRSKNNMNIQSLHALWLGLCTKVEKHDLTTNQASVIFDSERTRIIELEEFEASKNTKVAI